MEHANTAPRVNGQPLPEPIPIDRIRKKVASFHEKMNWLADFLEKYKDEVPEEMRIKKEDLKLAFYIDRRAVARLMRICMRPDFTQLGVFFGLQAAGGDPLKEDSKEFGQFTGIFVGVNENLEMLDCHFAMRPLKSENDEHIEGEDTWPPPPPPPPGKNGVKATALKNYFSLSTAFKEIREYFADEKL
jgi:hypothetical protein